MKVIEKKKKTKDYYVCKNCKYAKVEHEVMYYCGSFDLFTSIGNDYSPYCSSFADKNRKGKKS